MRILYKLLLAFLGVALLASVAMIYAVRESRIALQEAIGQQSMNLAIATMRDLNGHLFQRVEQIKVYAQDVSQEPMLFDSNEEYGAMADARGYIDELDSNWRAVGPEEVNPLMDSLINSPLAQEIRDEFEFREYYLENYGFPVFAEVFVTNAYGANIAQTSKTTDFRQDDEVWWQTAYAEGLFVGEIQFDVSSQVFSYDLAVSLHDPEGKFLGVIKAVVNVLDLIEILDENPSDNELDTPELKLVTFAGTLIHDTTGEYQPMENIAHLEWFSQCTEDAGRMIIENADGSRSLLAYARCQGYRGGQCTNWMITIEFNADAVLAPVMDLQNSMERVAVVIMLLALLLGVVISYSVSTPIAKLKTAIQQIDDENLFAPINVRSNDEVGDLAVSFKEMLATLGRKTTSISMLNEEIARRRKVENELRMRNDELLKANEEISKQQEMIVKSEKMASIGVMAAGVAHEINNPMGFVKSNLGTLKEYVSTFQRLLSEHGQLSQAMSNGKAEDAQALQATIQRIQEEEDIEYIQSDVDQLLAESVAGIERVTDIVGALRIYADTDSSGLRSADVNDCIEAALKVVWNELKYKCTIQKQLEPLPPIKCQFNELQRVFVNLLINAGQAIVEKGEIKINSEATDQEVIVRVSDTGMGISPQDISKVFDPFFTTKDVGTGTGLGLSVSHAIIEQHKGSIQVESEVGKGTTFTIRLPREEVPNE